MIENSSNNVGNLKLTKVLEFTINSEKFDLFDGVR